jgi:hypothetical protein
MLIPAPSYPKPEVSQTAKVLLQKINNHTVTKEDFQIDEIQVLDLVKDIETLLQPQ